MLIAIPFRFPRHLLVSVVLGGTLALLACNETHASSEPREDAKSAEAPVVVAEATPQAAGAPAGQARYAEEAFTLELKSVGEVKAGAATRFEIELRAAGGFKVNDEYPLKFKTVASSSVQPAKEVVGKDEAKVEKKSAVLPFDATIKSAGRHAVGGKLSFSVCTEERCLIEKRDLVLTVNAS